MTEKIENELIRLAYEISKSEAMVRKLSRFGTVRKAVKSDLQSLYTQFELLLRVGESQ